MRLNVDFSSVCWELGLACVCVVSEATMYAGTHTHTHMPRRPPITTARFSYVLFY